MKEEKLLSYINSTAKSKNEFLQGLELLKDFNVNPLLSCPETLELFSILLFKYASASNVYQKDLMNNIYDNYNKLPKYLCQEVSRSKYGRILLENNPALALKAYYDNASPQDFKNYIDRKKEIAQVKLNHNNLEKAMALANSGYIFNSDDIIHLLGYKDTLDKPSVFLAFIGSQRKNLKPDEWDNVLSQTIQRAKHETIYDCWYLFSQFNDISKQDAHLLVENKTPHDDTPPAKGYSKPQGKYFNLDNKKISPEDFSSKYSQYVLKMNLTHFKMSPKYINFMNYLPENSLKDIVYDILYDGIFSSSNRVLLKAQRLSALLLEEAFKLYDIDRFIQISKETRKISGNNNALKAFINKVSHENAKILELIEANNFGQDFTSCLLSIKLNIELENKSIQSKVKI